MLLAGMAVFGSAAIGTTAASADEPVSADVQALIERLERAEAEIQTLRSQVNPPARVRLSEGAGSPYTPVYYQEASPTDQGVADQALRTAPEGRAAAERREFDDQLDTRLRELEDRWSKLESGERFDALSEEFENFADRIDDLEEGQLGRVRRGTSNATAQLFGRLHGDWVAFPDADPAIDVFEGEDPQDRFVLRRARIGVKGDIRDNMFYKLETEFANPNNFEFRDLYFGFRDVPVFQSVVIGNHKRPYGLDHLNSSRYNVFIGRPFVIESFNEDARRLGVSANGVSEDLGWNWRYGVWNLERIQDDGNYTGDAYQGQIAGRLARTYWWDEASDGRGYGHWAIAGTVADPDETGGPQNANEARFRTRPEARTRDRWLNTGRIADVERFSILGFEHVLNYGAFQWTSEIQGNWANRNDGSDDTFFWGGYTYVSYFLTGEHMPWSRDSGTLGRPKPLENFFWVDTCDGCRGGGLGAWQVAARYSYLDMNDADVFGGVGRSLTLGLNWYWNTNASMQFNYIFGDITNAAVANSAGNSGTPLTGEYEIATVRMRIDF